LISHPLAAQQQAIDQQRELKMKIRGPFTLVAVGDINEDHMITQMADPAVQGIFKIVRSANVAMANMESSIVDLENSDTPVQGTTGPKQVAEDVKAMGFRIVNRANNHAMEDGVAGMLETNHWLDAAGIIHAGAGKNLDEARAAAYLETPKGRISMVGMNSTGTPSSSGSASASYKLGIAGGLPGVNSLHLTMYQIVSANQMEVLRKIQADTYSHRTEIMNPVPPLSEKQSKDTLRFSRSGDSYKVGTTPGGLSYTMNPEDLREIMRSIRNGKEYSDFTIATIHAHEDPSALQLEWFSENPPDFLIELAHKSIDNGADAFVGHGVHVLRGVEIYKGKPIFYGLGTFVWQLNQQATPLDRYTYSHADPYSTEMTDAELQWTFWDAAIRPRMNRDNLESVVAECRYNNGLIVEVLLHPIEMGFGTELAHEGIPRLASPEAAQRILQRLQKISKPFGTTISIENNVGIIRVPPESSQSTSSNAPAHRAVSKQ
jgi:poly-gamma-glutamate synthesis protein (capsule biosynthesis protein)